MVWMEGTVSQIFFNMSWFLFDEIYNFFLEIQKKFPIFSNKIKTKT